MLSQICFYNSLCFSKYISKLFNSDSFLPNTNTALKYPLHRDILQYLFPRRSSLFPQHQVRMISTSVSTLLLLCCSNSAASICPQLVSTLLSIPGEELHQQGSHSFRLSFSVEGLCRGTRGEQG